MHAPRAAFVGLVVLVSALAGCAGLGDGVETSGDILPPTNSTGGSVTPSAHFEIVDLRILAPNEKARQLYEDDAEAIVRYTVRQPADVEGAETAFVTYILNERIVDVLQLKLAPGEEKNYERRVTGLRDNRTLHVEVRAASASAKAEATVLDWPRAGQDELILGPLAIRVPYGLVEQDGRVLVNLSLDHRGPAQTFREFRMKGLCLGGDGSVNETASVRVEPPTLGNSSGVDVLLPNCPEAFYGLEFEATGAEGEIFGRLLLVPEGWRPPQP